MRVPPPGLVVLDREATLRAVAARQDVGPPPDDAAWALIEEIARFSEAMAQRLDKLPAELLQATVSTLRVALEPAVPALAMLVAVPKAEGALEVREEVDATTFLAPRTEARGPVVFVPCERRVNLVTGAFTGWFENRGGELYAASTPPAGVAAARPSFARSTAFDGERIRYHVSSPDPGPLQRAIGGLVRRRVGWLRMEIAQDGPGLDLVATVDPNASVHLVSSFPNRTAEADWNRLDGLTWRPAVRLSSALTAAQQRQITMGLGEGDRTLELRDLPPDVALDALLEPSGRVAPSALVDALWHTLRRLSPELQGSPSAVRRDLQGAAAGTWIEAAVRASRWPPIYEDNFTAIAVQPRRAGAGLGEVRLAFAFIGPVDPVPVFHFFTRTGESFDPLPAARASQVWRLPLPTAAGEQHEIFAWDVTIPASVEELITVVSGPRPVAAWLNAVLALNAPRVREGLRQPIRDLAGITVPLRGKDIVSLAVMGQLRDRALRGATLPALEVGRFPLARFSVEGAPPVIDGLGVRWDEVAGQVTLPGVAAGPGERSFSPGQVVELRWYRRTDGVGGALPAGTVAAFDQLAVEKTLLSKVSQPYATVGGRGVEDAVSAQLRALRPPTLAPVLPTEVETDLLVALGALADGWRARVWTACDGQLGRTWRWDELPTVGATPLAPPEPVIAPATLRVALGPRDRILSDADLRDLRLRLESWFQDLQRRAPVLRTLELTALRHLRLVPYRPLADTPALPMTSAAGLCPLDRLVDPTGAERAPPPRGALGDALIVSVDEPVARDPWRGEELVLWLKAALGQGVAWDASVWTPDERSRQAPEPWSALAPLHPPELRCPFSDRAWAAPDLREPAAAGLIVALWRRDVPFGPASLEAVRPAVQRWARWVGRRGGPEVAPTLLPLRLLHAYPLRTSAPLGPGNTGLLDPWGEARKAGARALLGAIAIPVDLDGSPIRAPEVARLGRTLVAALWAAGWRWRAQIWLPGDRVRLTLLRWEDLARTDAAPAPRSPAEGHASTAVVAICPLDGRATMRDFDEVAAFARDWWERAAASVVLGVRALAVIPMRPLRVRTNSPARAPGGLPSPWMAQLTDADQLLDDAGVARVPVPRSALLDGLIVAFAASEAADGV